MSQMTLTQARAAKNMTQLKLAYECGINPCTLSRMEYGHNSTTKETFLKICAVLGVDPRQICGITIKRKIQGSREWEVVSLDED